MHVPRTILNKKYNNTEIEREFHCSGGAGSRGSYSSPAECPRSGYACS